MTEKPERDDTKERPPSDSYIRYNNISSRIDDLTELLTAVLTGIQSLKLRHLIVIGFIFMLFLTYLAFNWVILPDNRSVLLNIAGRSRLVGFVDNCGVIKIPFNDSTTHVVFIHYLHDNNSRYIAQTIQNYDTNKIRPICASLYLDQKRILNDGKN